jgi:hypothetical protein
MGRLTLLPFWTGFNRIGWMIDAIFGSKTKKLGLEFPHGACYKKEKSLLKTFSRTLLMR